MIIKERLREWRDLEFRILEKVFFRMSDEKTFESLVSHATKLIGMVLHHRGAYDASLFDVSDMVDEDGNVERSDEEMIALLNKMIPDV